VTGRVHLTAMQTTTGVPAARRAPRAGVLVVLPLGLLLIL